MDVKLQKNSYLRSCKIKFFFRVKVSEKKFFKNLVWQKLENKKELEGFQLQSVVLEEFEIAVTCKELF